MASSALDRGLLPAEIFRLKQMQTKRLFDRPLSVFHHRPTEGVSLPDAFPVRSVPPLSPIFGCMAARGLRNPARAASLDACLSFPYLGYLQLRPQGPNAEGFPSLWGWAPSRASGTNSLICLHINCPAGVLFLGNLTLEDKLAMFLSRLP